MGEFEAILTGARVAGTPTFIPGITGPERNHTITTVMVNRRGRDNKEYSDSLTVHFWGKSANMAANYLSVGKQCNIRGRLQDYTSDTGQVRNGKRVLNRKVEVNAIRCELLADSMKEVQAAFDAGIIALKSAGRLDPNTQIALSDILPKKNSMIDFNPVLAAQTGTYGRAKVWSKDRGFWTPGVAAPVAAATAVPVDGSAAVIAAQAAEIAALKGQAVAANGAGADAGIGPF